MSDEKLALKMAKAKERTAKSLEQEKKIAAKQRQRQFAKGIAERKMRTHLLIQYAGELLKGQNPTIVELQKLVDDTKKGIRPSNDLAEACIELCRTVLFRNKPDSFTPEHVRAWTQGYLKDIEKKAAEAEKAKLSAARDEKAQAQAKTETAKTEKAQAPIGVVEQTPEGAKK